MVNPYDIVDRIVEALGSIAELGAHLDDEPASGIRPYHDAYPRKVDLEDAIGQMPQPGILVAWRGTGPARRRAGEVWVHRFSLILRVADQSGLNRKDYAGMWIAIMNGIPAGGDGQPFRRAAIDPNLLPPDTPSIERRSILLDGSSRLDYFEILLSYTQIGDDD